MGAFWDGGRKEATLDKNDFGHEMQYEGSAVVREGEALELPIFIHLDDESEVTFG